MLQKISAVLSRETDRIELVAIILYTTIANIYFDFFYLSNIYSLFVFNIILLITIFTSSILEILFDTKTIFFSRINFDFCQIQFLISIVVFESSISKFLKIKQLSKAIISKIILFII